MEDNLSEVNIERMFEKYIPGEDPDASLLEDRYYYSDACAPNSGSRTEDGGHVLNPTLCKIANSVVAHAGASPTVVIRQDISCPQIQVGSEEDKLEASKNGTPTRCAIYFDSDRARGDIIALLEAADSHSHCAFEFKKPDVRFTRDHTTRGSWALDQFAEHIAQVLARQHRTHVLALDVFRDQARLCYFDRSGGVISKPFYYGSIGGDTTLQRFFYRLARMTREQLGFDPTTTLASEEVVDDLRNWAATLPSEYLREQTYHALCWDPNSGLSVPEVEQWPTHEIAFKGKTLYVGKPAFSSKSLFGRCTRGYVAIEKETGEDGSITYALRFLKDSWRLAQPKARPEHEVYERLASRGVSEYVPTCLGGEDVPGDGCGGAVWQQTKTWAAMGANPRGHYRLLLKEVCRPLSDFDEFSELALVLGDALSAHRDAWVKAEILHCDISQNNILIYETKDENGDDARVGLLADWELSQYKENIVTGPGPTKPHNTGTWAFRSAVSQRYPTKPYAASDDIESFVHVFHYCVLRFHKTGHSHNLAQHIRAIYECGATRAADGAHFGGASKFANMRSPLSHIFPEDNSTLFTMLGALARLCAAHYATINMAEDDRRYNPPAAPKEAPSEPDASEPPVAHRLYLHRAHKWLRDIPSTNTTPNRAGLRSVIPPRPTLQDHDELLDVFWKWGTCEWPARDLKRSREDLLKRDELDLNKNRGFWSSQTTSGSSQSSDAEEGSL